MVRGVTICCKRTFLNAEGKHREVIKCIGSLLKIGSIKIVSFTHIVIPEEATGLKTAVN